MALAWWTVPWSLFAPGGIYTSIFEPANSVMRTLALATKQRQAYSSIPRLHLQTQITTLSMEADLSEVSKNLTLKKSSTPCQALSPSDMQVGPLSIALGLYTP